MPIQSMLQLGDNVFVVVSVVPWSGDPNRNIVTLQALVPKANTNCVAVGQAYLISDGTLTSNANVPATVNPGFTAFPLGR